MPPDITQVTRVPGSFRDPSGFLFIKDSTIFRSVDQSYKPDYDKLMGSGLYDKLVAEGLLIPHIEVSGGSGVEREYKLLQPERIPFVSYPYEWCFSQLKDAALATLRIQLQALKHGMSLKDASAYNIQFQCGAPALIDTLSFETCKEGRPWVAYRQFCQHFLGPLALMARRDIRLGALLKQYIDGPPLDLVSNLLPITSWLNIGLLVHIHMHARAQRRYAGAGDKTLVGRDYSRKDFVALLSHLESSIDGLSWRPAGTEWADYYQDTNYSGEAMEHKRALVGEYLDAIPVGQLWDLGANTGEFSRLASGKERLTVAFDVDPAAVEKNYRRLRKNKENSLLPLCLDLTNPSPGLGWANEERGSLAARGPVVGILALALVHHLAISNNLPLGKIAGYLSLLGEFLIIEFVPKEDSQVQRLLASREDVFPGYNAQEFKKEFSRYFEILKSSEVRDTKRTLCLMRRR